MNNVERGSKGGREGGREGWREEGREGGGVEDFAAGVVLQRREVGCV